MAYQWTKTDAAAPERVLLIGLDCGDYDAEASMAELERLTDTAGGLVVGHTEQKRPAPEGATYIGSGLVESLAEFCRQNEVDLTVADGRFFFISILLSYPGGRRKRYYQRIEFEPP